jgi:hypothetical protein
MGRSRDPGCGIGIRGKDEHPLIRGRPLELLHQIEHHALHDRRARGIEVVGVHAGERQADGSLDVDDEAGHAMAVRDLPIVVAEEAKAIRIVDHHRAPCLKRRVNQAESFSVGTAPFLVGHAHAAVQSPSRVDLVEAHHDGSGELGDRRRQGRLAGEGEAAEEIEVHPGTRTGKRISHGLHQGGHTVPRAPPW